MTVKGPLYRFDDVLVDVANQQVTVGGDERALEPKVFRLLQFLIENRDRVVRKEEIIAAVWTDASVSDNSLTRAVAQVRKALGDDSKEPRYIATVPTVGYRFLGDIKEGGPAPKGIPRKPYWAAGVVLVFGVAAAVWALGHRSEPGHVVLLNNQQFTSHEGLDMNAAYSPDGHLVAFASDRTGTFEIFVRTLEPGAPEIQLTNEWSDSLLPSFSPGSLRMGRRLRTSRCGRRGSMSCRL
jgi:DNA-binding winged helix-turn-helix (wHTH) protein